MNDQMIAFFGVMSGLLVSLASLGVTWYLWKRQADHEREQVRYGLVYTHRFKAAMRIHVLLARVRDRYEDFTYFEGGSDHRRETFPALHRAANKFRRVVRENEVLFPEHIAKGFDSIWRLLKQHLYATIDQDRDRGLIDPIVRQQTLDAIDSSISQIQPYMRKEFGIQPVRNSAVRHADSVDPPQ